MAGKSPVEAAMIQVRDLIDSLTNPKLMTMNEYDEFLDELSGEIEGRVECRRDEKALEETGGDG